ncbi:hypothetical protein IW261DRAFT_1443836 [Armillaria novae-zelandiae]|uniref:Uncharacterized protein n=1 Tax=Armillaria novae-zelandiae TaxID=153914 RepID=A0AA39PU45_9AGAR|nr:hypothetical protein IW261DRAFT_1443836 [Armillaria novae-zelandiae]
MPYNKLPPLNDDLDLNNFDTLAASSKRAQNLGPLWFIPPRYKPTRSNTRLDVISIRQSRYRDRRPRAVSDQGNSSDVYGDPRYMLSPNTSPATLYTHFLPLSTLNTRSVRWGLHRAREHPYFAPSSIGCSRLMLMSSLNPVVINIENTKLPLFYFYFCIIALWFCSCFQLPSCIAIIIEQIVGKLAIP